MLLLFCMSAKLALSKLNLLPWLSKISSSARQQGRTVPMGLASRLIQGNTQKVEFGQFILVHLILGWHPKDFLF